MTKVRALRLRISDTGTYRWGQAVLLAGALQALQSTTCCWRHNWVAHLINGAQGWVLWTVEQARQEEARLLASASHGHVHAGTSRLIYRHPSQWRHVCVCRQCVVWEMTTNRQPPTHSGCTVRLDFPRPRTERYHHPRYHFRLACTRNEQ